MRNVSDDQIDMFLFYETDQAIQIVHDLIDQRKTNIASSNFDKIDNEMRNMATRITKSHHYAHYKTAINKTSKPGK